jgi:hypothetical protein
MLTVRKYIPTNDYHFVCQSIDNDYLLNRREATLSGQSLDSYLGTNQIFIVHRNNKDLGFFTTDSSDWFGLTCWSHPRACKMSMVHLVRAAAIRCAWSIVNHNSDVILGIKVIVWHPLVSRTIRKVIPELREERLDDDYRLLTAVNKDFQEASTRKTGFGMFRNIHSYDYADFNSEELTFTLLEDF